MGAKRRNIDHPIAHHAAVVEHILGRHQPVADMKAEDAPSCPARAISRSRFGIPPDMIDIDADAQPRSAAGPSIVLAHVERLAQQRQAVTVRRIDRMQGFERDADAELLAMLKQQAPCLPPPGPGPRQCPSIPWAGRPPPSRSSRPQGSPHHRARAGCPRYWPRSRAVGGRQIGAAAIARDLQPGIADAPRDGGHIMALDLAPPRRDAAKACRGHGIDRLAQSGH